MKVGQEDSKTLAIIISRTSLIQSKPLSHSVNMGLT